MVLLLLILGLMGASDLGYGQRGQFYSSKRLSRLAKLLSSGHEGIGGSVRDLGLSYHVHRDKESSSSCSYSYSNSSSDTSGY